MKTRIKLELEVEVEEDDKIRDVKWRLYQMIGVPTEHLIIDRLPHQSRQMMIALHSTKVSHV